MSVLLLVYVVLVVACLVLNLYAIKKSFGEVTVKNFFAAFVCSVIPIITIAILIYVAYDEYGNVKLF